MEKKKHAHTPHISLISSPREQINAYIIYFLNSISLREAAALSESIIPKLQFEPLSGKVFLRVFNFGEKSKANQLLKFMLKRTRECTWGKI
jgi:hypothetical protein